MYIELSTCDSTKEQHGEKKKEKQNISTSQAEQQQQKNATQS